MIDIKDLEAGQEVYYFEGEIDVKIYNFEWIKNVRPYIVKEIKKNEYMKIYEVILQDGDSYFSITTLQNNYNLYTNKRDSIKAYIHYCNKYIKPVYEQMQLAEKYLEETKECLQ